MKKRLAVLLVTGALAVFAEYEVVSGIARRAELPDDVTPDYSWANYAQDKGPQVLLGFDNRKWRVENAIRIDIRHGMAITRANEAPIRDVTTFVTNQLNKKGGKVWVVITASSEEKFGDIVKVVDACRETHVHGIVLNRYADAWREK